MNNITSDLQLTDDADQAPSTASVINELGAFYGGIATADYVLSHFPPPGTPATLASFTSTAKWSHYLTYQGEGTGQVVLTAKRTGALKIGPIYVARAARRQGVARQLLIGLQNIAPNLGFSRLVLTVSDTNWPMRGALLAAGFTHSHTLRRHYALGHDEFVYTRGYEPSIAPTVSDTTASVQPLEPESWVAKFFFSTDDRWRTWLSSAMTAPTSLEAPFAWVRDDCFCLMLPKRGGTLTAIPGSVNTETAWNETARAMLSAVTALDARKLSVLVPEICANDLTKAFAHEGVGLELDALLPTGSYSTHAPIAQLAFFPTSTR